MIRQLDLNADLGEGMGNDSALLEIVTSASIACGGHAGDVETMRAALKAARDNGVRAGAHPGFSDPDHFGRRRLDLPHDEIARDVTDQIGKLACIASDEGVALNYFKLHGALANMAAEDDALALTVFAAIRTNHSPLAALVLENSAQERAALHLGMEIIREAYADRAYMPGGLLASREISGAVIHDEAEVIARCIRLAEYGEIVVIDGSVLKSEARSICLHGDTKGAVNLARKIRTELSARKALVGT